MPLLTLDVGVCAATLVVVALLYAIFRRRSHLPCPPGPRGLPILGNIFDVPEKRPWLAYARWSQVYDSPIIYLRMLGTPVIVINNFQTAQDLFDKRGEIYSERPRMAMLTEALGFDWDFSFTSDGQLWKHCRREFDPRFRQIAARGFRTRESSDTHHLLNWLLDTPNDFMKHFRYMTGSIILDISYGIKAKSEDDEYIELGVRAQENMETALDKNVVDIIPWVMRLPTWLPGMGWKKELLFWRDQSWKMRDAPFDFIKRQIEGGSAKACFATDLLLNAQKPHTLSEDEWEYVIKCACSTTYSAGSDTTVAGLNILVMTMMMYPEVQQKAQEQIDRVVGPDRLPTFDDMDTLPYVTAIVREILRWAAFVPGSIPHQTRAPDVYKGYYIPKGAVVIGNSWAILHDPEAYPDPDHFLPERFLTPDGRLDPNVRKPDSAFGYGRRICPGRFMATDTMWIASANLLAAFTFHKPNGESVTSKDRIYNPELFQSGLMGHPFPFNCDIRPRSERVVQLIRETLQTEEE